MALFNDSGLIGIADLEAYEVNLSKVASTHGINIDTKTAMTLDQVGDRLLQRLVRAGTADSQYVDSVLTGAASIYSLLPQQGFRILAEAAVRISKRDRHDTDMLFDLFDRCRDRLSLDHIVVGAKMNVPVGVTADLPAAPV